MAIPVLPLISDPPTQPTPSQSGNISRYVSNWHNITSNQFILRIVSEGYKLQFNSTPIQLKPIISKPPPAQLPSIKSEITSHLQLGAINEVPPAPDQYVSRIFIVKKRNGNDRMIIDLSSLNNHITKVSFRMEGTDSIKNLLQKDDFMVSIDLSDAFFSVPLHPSSKKFVTFEFNGLRYSFNVLPFGLSSSPRIFCKLLRPVIIFLRSLGIRISAYMDDLFLCSASPSVLNQHCTLTLDTLTSLGFRPNNQKSQLSPTKLMTHLGYIWNTSAMTLSLPEEKCIKTCKFAVNILSEPQCSLRRLASFLGLLVSHSTGFAYSALHFRKLQLFYNRLLMGHDWDDIITLSPDAITDIAWWSKNCIFPLPANHIKPLPPSITVHTDASMSGWGMSSSDGTVASGSWSDLESKNHINFLELYCIFLAINCLIQKFSHCHIHIVTDSTTAMFYINKLGGTHSAKMCRLALDIWDICSSHSIWLSASHIAGVDNSEADYFSRLTPDNHDYSLNHLVFDDLLSSLQFEPKVDLFASRITRKLNTYVSKSLDPFAWQIDAFSFLWQQSMYMFPPICMISQTVEKFMSDKVPTSILITPFWPGLLDIPKLFDLSTLDPVLLPASALEGTRPTRHEFNLVAWTISTLPADLMVFQQLRSARSSIACTQTPLRPTSDTGTNSPPGWLKAGIHLTSLYP